MFFFATPARCLSGETNATGMQPVPVWRNQCNRRHASINERKCYPCLEFACLPPVVLFQYIQSQYLPCLKTTHPFTQDGANPSCVVQADGISPAVTDTIYITPVRGFVLTIWGDNIATQQRYSYELTPTFPTVIYSSYIVKAPSIW